MKFNKLIPEISVSNLNKSIDFYTKILGFRIGYQRDESNFVFLSFQGSQIMLQKKNDTWKTGELKYPFGRGINFQFEAKNVKKMIDSLNKNGYPIKIPMKDNWYRVGKQTFGQREFLVMDPDGYLLRFSQDIGIKKAEK